ncbi:SDR family oxidoreductase [Salinisphaera sp. T31B1]|uniref:SDR family oxidoreductase n=1 Tax=Salinisphaera sp. T31B1 TaxID=727963 RepID=UPI0033429F4E
MTESSSQHYEQILITGANRNVGAHLAHRFIDDGYAVIAQYRSHTDEIERLAARGAQLVQGEFGDRDSCLAIAQRIGAVVSGLRAIVHNASAFAPTRSTPTDAADQFQAFFEVHMLAPYLLNTSLAPLMTGSAATPADIVHITDIHADRPVSEYDVYCATKAGLQSLALSQAKRLAPAIKVNVIQPGPLSFEAWHDPACREAIIADTPLRRTGTPEHVYRAIAAIMGNDFQTGAVIAVDGGRRLGG